MYDLRRQKKPQFAKSEQYIQLEPRNTNVAHYEHAQNNLHEFIQSALNTWSIDRVYKKTRIKTGGISKSVHSNFAKHIMQT